jgi:hypothetical protein
MSDVMPPSTPVDRRDHEDSISENIYMSKVKLENEAENVV